MTLLLARFSHQCLLEIFPWSLRDSKYPQVSQTLLSILADLYNSIVRMVSFHRFISKSSLPYTNPLVTVPSAPITTGINVTFMIHSFFRSLARSRYFSPLSLSFSFILWSAKMAKSTFRQALFFFCRLSLDLVV